jgi:iron(III) transport system substrate-binding protein
LFSVDTYAACGAFASLNWTKRLALQRETEGQEEYQRGQMIFRGLLFFAIGLLTVVMTTWISTSALAQSLWETIVEAANREGEVSLYATDDFEILFREFHRKYPKIVLKGFFGRGRDAALRMLSERRAGKNFADLYLDGMTTGYNVLYKAKVLDPISDALVLPEVVDSSKWWQGRIHYVDPEQKYLLIFNGQTRVDVSYNTKLVNSKEFKSYWDFLNPKWKANIAVMDPNIEAAGTAMRFMYHHPDLGQKYLRKFLTEMDVVISRDSRQMADWLGSGRIAFVMLNAVSRMDLGKAKQQGLPVDWFGPGDLKEGAAVTAATGGVALINHAPHPNAAKVAINWLLSREGQTTYQRLFTTGEEGPDSLRVDISKENVPRASRRIEGDEKRFPQTDKREWMDMGPIIKFLRQLKE